MNYIQIYLKKLYWKVCKFIGFSILIRDERSSTHSNELKLYNTITGKFYLPKYAYQDVIKKEIIDEIENTGYFFLENAIRKDHLDQIILDLSDKNFGLNNNFITPVWAKTQYYFTNALATSQAYFNLITSSKFLSIAKSKFNNNFRLKCHRYYETMFGHHMVWHADNVDNQGNVHENDGLIFIMYVNDVFDGEFQLIKETNLKENHSERKLNYSSDKFVEKNFQDKIISFKGKAGSIIIYDTWHLHRAKPIKSKTKGVII